MNTENITEKARLTIALTNRPPVGIVKEDWPVIASVHDYDNQYEFQANRHWYLTVRQHEDGRTVVYGKYSTQFPNEHDRRAGELVEANGNIAAAILNVAETLEFENRLAQECIADLPAENLE
jgi:hypothetical protein